MHSSFVASHAFTQTPFVNISITAVPSCLDERMLETFDIDQGAQAHFTFCKDRRKAVCFPERKEWKSLGLRKMAARVKVGCSLGGRAP